MKSDVFSLSPRFLEKYKNIKPSFGPVGELTCYRSYSRKQPNGQNESWAEIIKRAVEGAFQAQIERLKKDNLFETNWNNNKAQASAQEMYDIFFHLKAVPPGRGLWMMGTKYVSERGSAALQNCGFFSSQKINVTLAEPFINTMDMLMLGVGIGGDTRGAGKAAIKEPRRYKTYTIKDSREGWLDLTEQTINAINKPRDYAFPLTRDYQNVRGRGTSIKGFGGESSGPTPLEKLIQDIISIFGFECKIESSYNENGDIILVISEKPININHYETISSMQICDLYNTIGKCVVSGNVRRSAEILLGENDDEEFLQLKDIYAEDISSLEGLANILNINLSYPIPQYAVNILNKRNKNLLVGSRFREVSRITNDEKRKVEIKKILEKVRLKDYKTETGKLLLIDFGPYSWRWASNNAIIAQVGMNYEEFLRKYNLGKTGELGFFWLENARKYSRMIDPPDNKDSAVMGVNPCITGDTLISVADGRNAVAIETLVGTTYRVYSIENERVTIKKAIKTWKTRTKAPVYEIIFDDDSSFKATEDHLIMLRSKKYKRVDELTKEDILMPHLSNNQHRIKVVIFAGYEDVYDIKVEDTHNFGIITSLGDKDLTKTSGIFIHNCGEQSLEDEELCNLVEVFISRHDSLEDYKRTLKLAYLYAKSVSLIPTHRPKTNAITMKNRRIGTSVTGITAALKKLGFHELTKWLNSGYHYLRHLDRIYSDWLCVPRSKKITSVKPSGSVSKLAGVPSGVHFPPAEYYIQRIRVSENSAFVQLYKAAGYHVEDDIYTPHTTVIEIPIKEDNFYKSQQDVTIWEQISITVALQKYHADNQVSCTIYYGEDEIDQIPLILAIMDRQLKSISFLPKTNIKYKQAPWEPISKERYEELTKNTKPVDFSKITDPHERTDEYCNNDICEI